MSYEELILSKLNERFPNKEVLFGELVIIAREVGVSRERVRQIAEANHFLSARKTSKKNKIRFCWVCGKKYEDKTFGRATNCWCSPKCKWVHYQQKYWGLFECEQCSYYFLARKALVRRTGQRFCSKICQGRWFGTHYGWPANHFRDRRKHPDINQIKKDFPKGFTTKEFGKRYGYTSWNGVYNAVNSLVLVGKAKKKGKFYFIKD